MALERLWAGWRSEYVADAALADGSDESCVFCRILGSGAPDPTTLVIARHGADAVVLLNAYPYTSGHLLVVPRRHVAELEDLEEQEQAGMWQAATTAVQALKAAYAPDGINLGANLGRAAGAGVPGHLHLHVLPRWIGDTNFTTTVAEARVLPEPLDVTWQKLRDAWPHG